MSSLPSTPAAVLAEGEGVVGEKADRGGRGRISKDSGTAQLAEEKACEKGRRKRRQRESGNGQQKAENE